ncbi:MAG TPA: HAD-IIIA family hydrolase, partial [Rhodanobacteraceae bacterium]
MILDRDGVLNAERDAGGCIDDWTQWRWIAGALQALQRLHRMETKVSIVTNQSGVGRGRTTRARVDALHVRLVAEVARQGGGIDAVLVCPHAPEDGCKCRKPAPGLVLQAVARSGIRAEATVLVGDDLRDLDAAAAAGV